MVKLHREGSATKRAQQSSLFRLQGKDWFIIQKSQEQQGAGKVCTEKLRLSIKRDQENWTTIYERQLYPPYTCIHVKKDINEKLMVTNNCGKYLFRYNNDCASHEAINVKVKPGYHNKYIIKGYF